MPINSEYVFGFGDPFGTQSTPGYDDGFDPEDDGLDSWRKYANSGRGRTKTGGGVGATKSQGTPNVVTGQPVGMAPRQDYLTGVLDNADATLAGDPGSGARTSNVSRGVNPEYLATLRDDPVMQAADALDRQAADVATKKDFLWSSAHQARQASAMTTQAANMRASRLATLRTMHPEWETQPEKVPTLFGEHHYLAPDGSIRPLPANPNEIVKPGDQIPLGNGRAGYATRGGVVPVEAPYKGAVDTGLERDAKIAEEQAKQAGVLTHDKTMAGIVPAATVATNATHVRVAEIGREGRATAGGGIRALTEASKALKEANAERRRRADELRASLDPTALQKDEGWYYANSKERTAPGTLASYEEKGGIAAKRKALKDLEDQMNAQDENIRGLGAMISEHAIASSGDGLPRASAAPTDVAPPPPSAHEPAHAAPDPSSRVQTQEAGAGKPGRQPQPVRGASEEMPPDSLIQKAKKTLPDGSKAKWTSPSGKVYYIRRDGSVRDR